jgi:UDP-sugar transporter A1/2/3
MLVGVNSLSLLSPRAHAAAMAPPLLTRHTTPSLRLLRPPRLCMASVPPASEGSPEVGLPLSMTRVQLKYFVLLLLVLQNSVVALVTQATRMKTGVMYSGTAAVLASEVLKMPVCLALIARDVGVAGVRRELHQKVVEPWRDTLTMAVPALCYCLQNALFFVALSNLSAASYQLWSQSKTLSTALFFVLLLGKRLRKRQWFALVLLTAGVALVQYADTGTALRVGRPLVGILAVLASSLLSGFSNVYLEKRIKLGDSSGSGRTVSIWIRNVQLGLFSIPQSAALCLADRAAVTSAGIGALFAGFSPAVWSVVGLKAFGGLLVAAVVKYADNILKTYATAISIGLTCLLSLALYGTRPSTVFVIGAALIVQSVLLYN